MSENAGKSIGKVIGFIVLFILYIAIRGCANTFTCDYCGKKSSGTHYTITNDYNKDMCSSCYTSYHRRGLVD